MKILEWQIFNNKWAYIQWVGPDESKVKAYRELRQIESEIKERGLVGWIADSARIYPSMLRVLKKLGAVVYKEEKNALWFKKEINDHGKIG